MTTRKKTIEQHTVEDQLRAMTATYICTANPDHTHIEPTGNDKPPTRKCAECNWQNEMRLRDEYKITHPAKHR